MSLLMLGDSNVERSWLNVRNNRDLLRGATFVPVKRYDQIVAGFSAVLPSVSHSVNDSSVQCFDSHSAD